MTEEVDHILILLLGAIGDVARGLAVATHIKDMRSNTKITWAVEPISQSLVENHPAIDRVVVFKRNEKLRGYINFIKELRQERYDICLDLQRHFKSGLSTWLSSAPRRIGFDRLNSREFNWLFQTELISPQVRESPKIEQFFAFSDALGISRPQKASFGLNSTTQEREKISALLGDSSDRYVAMLIGSTWESRIWSSSYYVQLCKELYEKYSLCSILLGGPTDVEPAARIALEENSEFVLNLVGKTSLRELVAVFGRCSFAIGSDSGPMHIAAACGLPIVSLWGSTSPLRSGPYAWSDYCLQSAIGCSPCYRRSCPGLDNLCMKTLSPEIVLMQASRLIDEVGMLK